MHPYQHHIDLCNRALDAVREVVPAHIRNDVHDYINRFDEWGVGLETLIDALIDGEINITPQQFDLIHEAMASIELADCNRVAYLREHCMKE